MRIIAKKTLMDFTLRHANCASALTHWYQLAASADWANIEEVRRTFPSADPVGNKTVFNIKGNDFRLITAIHYNKRCIYIRAFLPHAEYDKDAWKTR